MFYKLISFIIIIIQVYCTHSQQIVNFNINMPNVLMADAGIEQYIIPGQSIVLGGNPTAIGGTSPFVYEWSPNQFLNDSTIANPISTPQQNISYNLKITDANNCIAFDNVNIYLSSTNINNYYNDDFQIFKDLENIKIKFKKDITNNDVIIELYDISGRQLFLNNLIIQNNTISFSNKSTNSICFLRIFSPNINRTIKLF